MFVLITCDKKDTKNSYFLIVYEIRIGDYSNWCRRMPVLTTPDYSRILCPNFEILTEIYTAAYVRIAHDRISWAFMKPSSVQITWSEIVYAHHNHLSYCRSAVSAIRVKHWNVVGKKITSMISSSYVTSLSVLYLKKVCIGLNTQHFGTQLMTRLFTS